MNGLHLFYIGMPVIDIYMDFRNFLGTNVHKITKSIIILNFKIILKFNLKFLS